MQFPTEPVQRVNDTDHYLVPMAVGLRAIAYLIDSLLFALVVILVLYAFDAVALLTDSRTLSYTQLVLVAAQCGYFFCWEAATGTTPGKRVFQMRVVRLDGSRCGVVGAFVRNLLLPIDLFFLGIIGALSIMAGFKRQRLGDRAARTQVVREVPLPFVPPPYVPADKPKARRCPRCGALAESGQSKCAVCSFDLDAAPPAQWPFGMPGAAARRPAAEADDGEEDYLDEEPEEQEPAPDERPVPAPGARRPVKRPARPVAPAEPPFAGSTPAADVGRDAAPTDLAADLYEEDTDARLYAGREILMEGGEEDMRELARAVGDWDASDRHFIVNIARTLDGWRPVLVLEALRNDADEEVAAGARDALATVTERNEREEEARLAWEAARAPHDDDEDDEEDDGHDEPPDDAPLVDDEPPPAPDALEAPDAPDVQEEPPADKSSRRGSPRRGRDK